MKHEMVFDGDVNLIHGFFRQDAYPLVSGRARYRPIYKPVSRIAKRKAPDDASAACASASADVALNLPKPSTKDVVQRSPPLLRKCCWALMCHPHTAKQDWTTSIITTICNPRAEERRCICPQRFVGPTDSELYCTSILVVHSCGGALMWLEPQ